MNEKSSSFPVATDRLTRCRPRRQLECIRSVPIPRFSRRRTRDVVPGLPQKTVALDHGRSLEYFGYISTFRQTGIFLYKRYGKMPPEDEIPGTHLKLSVKRVKLSYRYSSHVTIYTSLTKSDHTAPVSNGLIYMSH